MNTAISADMGQNNPMTDLHAVHVLGQRKIIQMNPFFPFFGRPGLPLGNGGNSYIAESLLTLQMISRWG